MGCGGVGGRGRGAGAGGGGTGGGEWAGGARRAPGRRASAQRAVFGGAPPINSREESPKRASTREFPSVPGKRPRREFEARIPGARPVSGPRLFPWISARGRGRLEGPGTPPGDWRAWRGAAAPGGQGGGGRGAGGVGWGSGWWWAQSGLRLRPWGEARPRGEADRGSTGGVDSVIISRGTEFTHATARRAASAELRLPVSERCQRASSPHHPTGRGPRPANERTAHDCVCDLFFVDLFFRIEQEVFRKSRCLRKKKNEDISFHSSLV